CVLCQELEIAIPQEFLGRAPTDARQRRLEVIARRRLFREVDGPISLNAFSRNTVFLLLHDSWLGRIRYLASWMEGRRIKSQGNVRRNLTDLAVTSTLQQIRQALGHWRHYRRALTRRT